MSVLISEPLQSIKTANKNYKVAKSNSRGSTGGAIPQVQTGKDIVQ